MPSLSLRAMPSFVGRAALRLVALCVALLVSVAPAMPAAELPDEHEIDYDIGMFAQSFDDCNPLVVFGFTPQPEPPAAMKRTVVGPTSASTSWSEVHGDQLFLILIGVTKGSGFDLALPTEPAAGMLLPAVQRMTAADYPGETKDTVLKLDFTTSSSGRAYDFNVVGFNPQPEPPAYLADFDIYAFSFRFSSLSTATVTFSVLDANGEAVQLTQVATPVPLPAGVVLGAGALACLGALRRKP